MSRGTDRPYAAGRIAFLTMLDEVREAVAAGVPVQQIYDARKERLGGIKRRQFAKYVEKHVAGPGSKLARHSMRSTATPRAVPRSSANRGPIIAQVEERKGFVYHAEGSDQAMKDRLV